MQQLGGFDAVTEKKLWKLLYDEMSGSSTSSSSSANPPQNAQSFSSIMKRHYERFDFLFLVLWAGLCCWVSVAGCEGPKTGRVLVNFVFLI